MKVTVNAFFAAFCLCCAVNAHLLAQPENLHFEHLSPNQVPHTTVWRSYQDQEGFMWFSTYKGLVKYDGSTTTIWKADPTDQDCGLQSQRILYMHHDRKGSLWFPIEGGVKALTDHSPSQFLRTIRLKRAAAMLLQKSDTISQIAYGVGFSNLSYFNKCFKEQFGMTPGQYAAAEQGVK